MRGALLWVLRGNATSYFSLDAALATAAGRVCKWRAAVAVAFDRRRACGYLRLALHAGEAACVPFELCAGVPRLTAFGY